MKKTLLSLTLVFALLLSLCVPALAEAGTAEITEEDVTAALNELDGFIDEALGLKAPAVTSKDMTFYLCSIDDTRTMPVYFIGDSDVPYISLEAWAELYPYLLRTYVHKGKEEFKYGLSYSRDGETGILTRTDGDPYTMTVDCENDMIVFYDYDAFIRLEADRALIDVLEADSSHSDEEISLFRRAEGSYARYGDQLVLDAGAYGIDLVADYKGIYVPMQTLSDFLLSLKYVNLFYNGDAVIFAKFGDLGEGLIGKRTEFGELYYSAEKREISPAMGAFSYNELCLAFDRLYGLKDIHGITCFDDLAQQAGAKEALMGPDPNAADAALYNIIFTHLDDKHSTFGMESAWSRDGLAKEMFSTFGFGRGFLEDNTTGAMYALARAQAYPDGVPAYQEVGNTAYITFDEFASIPEGVDFYQTPPTAENTDTIGLMIYA